MTVDFTQYQPPGVYVSDVSQALITAVGTPGTIVAIIAPSVGYLSAVETFPLFSEVLTSFRKNGVVVAADVVVKTLGGTLLALNTDYAITADTSGAEQVNRIKRLPPEPGTPSPGGLVDGDLVQVRYQYTDTTYFTPRLFEDYDLVTAAFGSALSSTYGDLSEVAQITSPLTLACRIAFEGGAPEIMALPVTPGGVVRDAYLAAYAKLRTDPRVGIIVPIFPPDEVGDGTGLLNYMTDLRAACLLATGDGNPRVGISGAPASFDEDAFPFEGLAEGLVNKRSIVVYPTRFNFFNQGAAQVFEIGGGYAAAAIAGILVSNDVERGLTRQIVPAFSGLPVQVTQQMTKGFKDNLSQKGVLVIEQDRSQRLVVRHGVTTDMSALNTREISLVRIADTLLINIREGLDNSGLIGDPIDDEMPSRVKGALQGILEQQRIGNIIVEWDNLLVRQQTLPSGDPSVIECVFSYRPAVPLNYITVSFSINLTTGVVEDNTETEEGGGGPG